MLSGGKKEKEKKKKKKKSTHSYMGFMLMRMLNGFIWNKITFQIVNVTRKLFF
jgi:hypothetical protein